MVRIVMVENLAENVVQTNLVKNLILPDLNKALTYQNSDLVQRFCKEHKVTTFEAEEIFMELKKWLWLIAVAAIERKANINHVPKKLVIDKPTIILDEMWHTFLCFTFEYQKYCNENFGFFIHHQPTPFEVNQFIATSLKDDPKFVMKRLKKQYEYVYDKLGEETLIKWYDIFPKKYLVCLK